MKRSILSLLLAILCIPLCLTQAVEAAYTNSDSLGSGLISDTETTETRNYMVIDRLISYEPGGILARVYSTVTDSYTEIPLASCNGQSLVNRELPLVHALFQGDSTAMDVPLHMNQVYEVLSYTDGVYHIRDAAPLPDPETASSSHLEVNTYGFIMGTDGMDGLEDTAYAMTTEQDHWLLVNPGWVDCDARTDGHICSADCRSVIRNGVSRNRSLDPASAAVYTYAGKLTSPVILDDVHVYKCKDGDYVLMAGAATDIDAMETTFGERVSYLIWNASVNQSGNDPWLNSGYKYTMTMTNVLTRNTESVSVQATINWNDAYYPLREGWVYRIENGVLTQDALDTARPYSDAIADVVAHYQHTKDYLSATQVGSQAPVPGADVITTGPITYDEARTLVATELIHALYPHWQDPISPSILSSMKNNVTLMAQKLGDSDTDLFKGCLIADEARVQAVLQQDTQFRIYYIIGVNAKAVAWVVPNTSVSTPADISVTVQATAGGTAAGSGIYVEGSTVTVTAVPANGYQFAGWMENNTLVSPEASYTFTALRPRTLQAAFTKVHTLTPVVLGGGEIRAYTEFDGQAPHYAFAVKLQPGYSIDQVTLDCCSGAHTITVRAFQDTTAIYGANYAVVKVPKEALHQDCRLIVTCKAPVLTPDTSLVTRLEKAEITVVPPTLINTPFDTVEKIKEELNRVLTENTHYPLENTVTMEVVLQYSPDNGQTWINATEVNFPRGGLTVLLPYPAGTGKNTHEFSVTHMFTITSSTLGTVAGQTETPTVTNLDAGIQVTLRGLSPIGIAWKTATPTHTVRWLNWDNTVLATDAYAAGERPVYRGATPFRMPSDGLMYIFSHWSPEIAPVTGDMSYKACFTALPLSVLQPYTLTFDTMGGKPLPTLTRHAPMTISLDAYTPEREGYTFTGWYEDAELSTPISSIRLKKTTIVYAGWQAIDPPVPVSPFTDVTPADPFFDAVLYVSEHSLMQGDGALFYPQDNLTRGMAAAILWRLSGAPQTPFDAPMLDVAEDMYYAPALQWAAAEGLLLGDGHGMFTPDDPITREDLCVLLYRYAKLRQIDVSLEEDAPEFPYSDAASISDYAIPAMRWIYNEGYMVLRDNDTCMPTDYALRSEVAVMLYRFCLSLDAN